MIEQVTGQRLVRMELKYCEGCGGLLLRRAGDAVVYCGSCAAKLAELPQTSAEEREPAAAGGKRRSNTPPKQSLDGAPQADDDARYIEGG